MAANPRATIPGAKIPGVIFGWGAIPAVKPGRVAVAGSRRGKVRGHQPCICII
jgi:hypothetical protein